RRGRMQTDGSRGGIGGVGGAIVAATVFQSQAAKIGVVSVRIGCCFNCQRLLLVTAELCLERLRNSFGDLALDAKNVSQLAVVGVCPEMGTGLRVNQLYIDPHLISRFLHAALKNVRYAKLLRVLGEIEWFALIGVCGSVRT